MTFDIILKNNASNEYYVVLRAENRSTDPLYLYFEDISFIPLYEREIADGEYTAYIFADSTKYPVGEEALLRDGFWKLDTGDALNSLIGVPVSYDSETEEWNWTSVKLLDLNPIIALVRVGEIENNAIVLPLGNSQETRKYLYYERQK